MRVPRPPFVTRRYLFPRTFILLAPVLFLLLSCSARAFSPADADAIFKSYNDAFYFTNGNRGYYRESTDGGKTAFWDRAEQLEMILDVYERSTNRACLTLFSNIFNGFIADHGTNWMSNDYNDDIMWMVIACTRAYQHTGNQGFRDIARTNFDLCYARAWSTNFGGGLWWKMGVTSKNACVNGPASIAASLLYRSCGDPGYLAKAKAAFEWERAHLFNAQTGQVYDNISYRRGVAERAFTYNEGTFIGAANFLDYTNEAKLAADYVKNTLCRDQLLPGYAEKGDSSGFNGICVRWLAKFMKQRGLEAYYQNWLQTNADAAWRVRRPADNLSWSSWSQNTPSGTVYSWACSCSVVMLQVVPPQAAAPQK